MNEAKDVMLEEISKKQRATLQGSGTGHTQKNAPDMNVNTQSNFKIKVIKTKEKYT